MCLDEIFQSIRIYYKQTLGSIDEWENCRRPNPCKMEKLTPKEIEIQINRQVRAIESEKEFRHRDNLGIVEDQ